MLISIDSVLLRTFRHLGVDPAEWMAGLTPNLRGDGSYARPFGERTTAMQRPHDAYDPLGLSECELMPAPDWAAPAGMLLQASYLPLGASSVYQGRRCAEEAMDIEGWSFPAKPERPAQLTVRSLALPETVVTQLVGRAVSEIVVHPAFADDGLLIEDATREENGSLILTLADRRESIEIAFEPQETDHGA